MKSQFLQQGYPMTWTEYMKFYGANSEGELQQLLALQQLSNRYILGYQQDGVTYYQGTNPITKEELQESYDNWFEVSASHIFFSVDEHSTNLETERKRAELLANQIIRGVNYEADLATGLLEAHEFIRYDYNNNGEREENEYFIGLNNTPASEYAQVFSTLARLYSEDPSSAPAGGQLGTYGPGKMVQEFEDATKALIASNYMPFSNIPCETKFGFHVIFIHNVTPKPQIPAQFAGKSLFEIEQFLQTNSNQDLQKYYELMKRIESKLIENHLSTNLVNQKLALLRNELQFKFTDPEMQEIYLNMNNKFIIN